MQRSILAAVMAVALAPAVATAGPKFAELEGAVPADVMDAAAINTALVAALGGDKTAIKAVQTECGLKGANVNGVLGPNTQRCLTNHAEVMARARKHAADDRAAIEADLAKCSASGGDCAKARDAALAAAAAAAKERDALAAKAAASGDEDGPPGPVDMTLFAGQNCPPGFQGRWLKNGQFTCDKPRWGVSLERPTADPSGSAYGGVLKVAAPAGREGLGQFPAHPPLPAPPGTCDGAGGKLLCYVLPIAAAGLATLFIVDAASDDFNLVTVER